MQNSTKRLVRSGVIAAAYVTLCMLFAPISYGPVQVRVSEAMALLPLLAPDAVFGLTIGCFLSNMLASSPIDMVVGTIATFLAAVATKNIGRRVRENRETPDTLTLFKAAVPPIVLNAVIVGWEITLFFSDAPITIPAFLINAASVGAGQVISCGILGVALMRTIMRVPALRAFFSGEDAQENKNNTY